MPKVIGLLCALVALAACVLAKADVGTSIIRALSAFAIGSLLTQAWYAFFATRITTAKDLEPYLELEEGGDQGQQKAA